MNLTAPSTLFDTGYHGSRPRAVVAIVAGLLVVFGIDTTTGPAPFQHLYYLPIILAGLTFEVAGGMTAALSAVLLYHLANPHLLTFAYEEADVVQIALFVLVGLVTAKLTRDRNELRRLAATDDLTGLHNLRAFEARLRTLVTGARQQRSPLAMLVLDVDRLKLLNDRYGHLVGAEAVRAVGHIIGRHIPPGSVACRYGGDEFAVALPHCAPADARRLADTIRQAVRTSALVLAGQHFPIGALSVSVGIAWGPLDGSGAWSMSVVDLGEALFREADAALYRAKAGGRNRVCLSCTSLIASADAVAEVSPHVVIRRPWNLRKGVSRDAGRP